VVVDPFHRSISPSTSAWSTTSSWTWSSYRKTTGRRQGSAAAVTYKAIPNKIVKTRVLHFINN
jgi:hypothetical protein